MPSLPRLLPSRDNLPDAELRRLLAMAGLYFLVTCAVGILRPVKNALALDGLAATEFYKVYLVSAAVVLAVPPYNRLANRIPWRRLIPGVAVFFALNLLAFRLLYSPGSTIFGVVLYGWFDLFSAMLITQFFIATQLFYNARDAKRAYPLVIAGGALGATAGGALTGLLAERVGTPDLLLLAAGFVVLFAAGMPLVWEAQAPGSRTTAGPRGQRLSSGDVAAMLRSSHLRLIAATVLLTVVVKQLVDYQFNTISKEIFLTRDAISAFQGKFNAATQWLPLLFMLGIRPILRRWGVAVVVLLLPAAMVGANLVLALWWGLAAAVLAKAGETGLRYSAERTGREILYVPVPERIKLMSKAYIDVAIEKGVGKVAASGLIFVLLAFFDHRRIGWIAAAAALAWLGVTLAVRGEYVRSLARSIEGRFASLRGSFASLADASTLRVVRQALAGGDPLRAAFALDLLEQAGPEAIDGLATELYALLEHPSAELRERALAVLLRQPATLDAQRIQPLLRDPARAVRVTAIRALCAAHPATAERTLRELLEAPESEVRTAALACLAEGSAGRELARWIGTRYIAARAEASRQGDSEARLETALAAAALEPEVAADVLTPLLDDADAEVVAAALRSAATGRAPERYPPLIPARRRPATRQAAREALVAQGTAILAPLAERLMDTAADSVVRRNIPSVLAELPLQESADVLLRCAEAPETDELLDFRILKALNKLRARHPELAFDAAAVHAMLGRELDRAATYLRGRVLLEARSANGAGGALLCRALLEAWRERRERAFRWLGLLHPAEEVYRAYLAIEGGEARARANALEWLEQTLGHAQFRRLRPVLAEPQPPSAATERVLPFLERLYDGGEPALAAFAAWVAAELEPEAARPRLQALSAAGEPALRELAADLLEGAHTNGPGSQRADDRAMNLVEKVFLLQQVDLLHGATSAHLALLASIAEELEVEEDGLLIRHGEPTDALYVVVRGAVELRGAGDQLLLAQDGTPFGTWALIDESPSLFTARTVRPTRLLRISRRDFHDLLADHHELALGLLRGLARRVHALVS